jgi:hypothetical protein
MELRKSRKTEQLMLLLLLIFSFPVLDTSLSENNSNTATAELRMDPPFPSAFSTELRKKRRQRWS